MKKIKTIFGYLYLPDERMVENTNTLHNETNHNKTMDMITITSDGTKKLTAGKPTRKIDFIEIP